MPKHIVKRLERLDYLICTKATGTPGQLASKLNLSERCVRRYICILKELGAPVIYCRKRKSYYYEEAGRFYFTFCKTGFNSLDEFGGIKPFIK